MPHPQSLRLTDDRAGLPKKTQTYFFFTIDDARIPEFRRQLAKLVPLITTTAQVKDDRQKIAQMKQEGLKKQDQHGHDDDDDARGTLKISGVNLAFTQKGLLKVVHIRPLVIHEILRVTDLYCQ